MARESFRALLMTSILFSISLFSFLLVSKKLRYLIKSIIVRYRIIVKHHFVDSQCEAKSMGYKSKSGVFYCGD